MVLHQNCELDTTLQQVKNYILHAPASQVSDKLYEFEQKIYTLQKKLNTSHFKVAFLGRIGVGKTSVISRFLGLQIFSEASDCPQDVLKTGSGRTTVCPVYIQNSTTPYIEVTPLSEEETCSSVKSFAEFIWAKAHGSFISDNEEGGNMLSSEVTRCIRNMLGLTIERRKLDSGKPKSIDKAQELASTFTSLGEFQECMFNCLDLERRTGTQLLFDETQEADWKVWLKKYFSEINDGKLQEFGIPKTVTIYAPLFDHEEESCWTVVDTKGIDSSVIFREDIQEVLDDEFCIPVICSSFSDAPDADCYSLIQFGVSMDRIQKLEQHTLLLIVDRNESSQVADIGDEVTDYQERVDTGRDIRESQVLDTLVHEFQFSPKICFFDCRHDNAEVLWSLLKDRKKQILSLWEKQLQQYIDACQEIINLEESKSIYFNTEVDNLFLSWRKQADLVLPNWQHFGSDLLDQMKEVHHSTLAASIRSYGQYDGFDFYYIASAVAKTKAVEFCKSHRIKLETTISSLEDEFSDFSDQIFALKADLAQHFEEFSSDVLTIVQAYWKKEMKSLIPWQIMDNEWGAGKGYQKKVCNHFSNWLHSSTSIEKHDQLMKHLISRWGRVLVKSSESNSGKLI